MVQPNLFTVISFLLAFLLFDISAAVGGRKIAGSWTPITDPSDPSVVEIGKFAVDEHNKEAKTAVKFGKVIKGETQVVEGMNYRLIIAATEVGKADKNYEAVVWDKPWEKFEKLISFRALLKN